MGGVAYLHCANENVLIEVISGLHLLLQGTQANCKCSIFDMRVSPSKRDVTNSMHTLQVYVCYNERLERTACSKQGTCKTNKKVQYLANDNTVEAVQ